MSTRHPEQVKRDLEELDRRRFKFLVPFAATFVWIVAVSATGGDFVIFVLPKGTSILIGAGLIFITMVVSVVSWRCPVCDGMLGEELYPSFCKKCGARLKEPESESGVGVPAGFETSRWNAASLEARPSAPAVPGMDQGLVPTASPVDGPLQQFERRRYGSLLAAVPLVLLLAGIWLLGGSIGGFLGLDRKIVLTLLVCSMVFAGVVGWIFWRCPFCQRNPGEGWNPRICGSCGASLRRD